VRIFISEKILTEDVAINCCSTRGLSGLPVENVDPAILITFLKKAAVKIIVLRVEEKDGRKCPIIFIADDEKINAEVYQGYRRQHVIPCFSAYISCAKICFLHGGAPAHGPNTTQLFMKERLSSIWFIEILPPYSPNLTPLDFKILWILQEKVQTTPYAIMEELKATIQLQWSCSRDNFIYRPCRSL